MGKQIKKKNVNVVDDDKEMFAERKNYKKKKIDFSKLRDDKIKKAHSYVKPKEIRAGGEIEYKMSAEEIADLLKNRKGPDKNKNAQEFLCDYVNEQCGLLGSCVRVLSF